MSKELSLPLTGDGTGYLKEAVEEKVALEQDQARKIVDRAQQLLSNAEHRSNEILADAEQRSNELIANAELEASNITSGLDKLHAAAMVDIEKEKSEILQKAEDDSRRKVAASEKKASHIIEEAMSKVHALVKTAQGKLERAKTDSKTLELESARKYADAVAKAGALVVSAEELADVEMITAREDAETLRLEAETMLAYSQEESRIILKAAQTEANKVADEAADYQQQVAEWAEAELSSAREKFEQFKAYYDDRVSRLNAMHQTSLEEIRILSGHEFPDGSHLKVNDEFAQHLATPAKDASESKVEEEPSEEEPVDKEIQLTNEKFTTEELPVEEFETMQELISLATESATAKADAEKVTDDEDEFIISDSQSEKLEEILGSLSTFDDEDEEEESAPQNDAEKKDESDGNNDDLILITDDKK